MSYHQTKLRYQQHRANAYAAATQRLSDALPRFEITGFTRDAFEAWSGTWRPWLDDNPGLREPPVGGWEWPEVAETFRNNPSKLDICVWGQEGELCGLAIGRLNSEAVSMLAVEGSPRSHSLRGAILLIVLETAVAYAHATDRGELWLERPSAEMVNRCTRLFGFDLVKGKGGMTYCKRQV